MTPPETGRPYNDFLEIFNDYLKMDKRLFGETHGFDIAEALGAWVRVREAEVVRDEAVWWYRRKTWPNEEDSARLSASRDALATARKQLEGATHGQAEATSAAASANSEPGGA